MDIRNICIIAHVDHGKTTLVDGLLNQAGTFRENETRVERVMDSMDLERERGITILSKIASIKLEDTKVNIVDTPGHADFGGEVERIMNMVDGAILLVDAAEGPLPQTRFVLQKALKHNLKIILVINKVDRPECRQTNRITEVIDETLDLFISLGADDEQLDFPVVYACARDGWATTERDDIEPIIEGQKKANLKVVFDTIMSAIPAPEVRSGDFEMLVSNLGYSDYVGRLAIGRVTAGEVKVGQQIIQKGNDKDQKFGITQIFTYEGLAQVPSDKLSAGDLGVIAGSQVVSIGDTLVAKEDQNALPRIEVEKPTVGMMFGVNTSPGSGTEGKAIQSRELKERLEREVSRNVALKFEETELPDQFRVLARGELQLAILMEQMRREGLEFIVGKPTVVSREIDGQKQEPVERLSLDVPEESVGDVTKLFQERQGIMGSYNAVGEGTAHKRIRLEFVIPTRGVLGTRSKFLSMTRGEGLMSSQIEDYAPVKSGMKHRQNGAMVADRTGKAIEYAIRQLEDRGIFFVEPGTPVYEGMIVGEYNKDTDLNVNICKEKKLTNVRAASADILVTLSGVRKLSLEDCIEWIDEDELIEITPENIRMRKKVLPGNMRSVKRNS